MKRLFLALAIVCASPVLSHAQQVRVCVPTGGPAGGAPNCQDVTPSNPLPIINFGSTYNTVAASQTAQVLSALSGGTTGASGDYLTSCTVIPATTSPGAVTILDGSTAIYSFPGGASSVPNLVPLSGHGRCKKHDRRMEGDDRRKRLRRVHRELFLTA